MVFKQICFRTVSGTTRIQEGKKERLFWREFGIFRVELNPLKLSLYEKFVEKSSSGDYASFSLDYASFCMICAHTCASMMRPPFFRVHSFINFHLKHM